jgi:hypothetical protein
MCTRGKQKVTMSLKYVKNWKTIRNATPNCIRQNSHVFWNVTQPSLVVQKAFRRAVLTPCQNPRKGQQPRSSLTLAWLTFRFWKRRQCVPAKCQQDSTTRQHILTSITSPLTFILCNRLFQFRSSVSLNVDVGDVGDVSGVPPFSGTSLCGRVTVYVRSSSMALQPLWTLVAFLLSILYTDVRTQPVARPLPTHRTT